MPLTKRPCEFVVTLGIDFADGRDPARVIHELFRGEPEECMALMFRVSTPSHDSRTIEHWWMQFGPAVDWENFAISSLDLAAR
jgi:hypothetical protein